MTEQTRKTVGSYVDEILTQSNDRQGVVDTQREMQKTYFDQIRDCIDNHKEWTEPYYILVRNKKEAYLPNVIRQYFWARRTRPSPDYDHTLWSYNPKSEDLKWEWTLPDEATCSHLLSVQSELPSDHDTLVKTIKDFHAGKLV